MVPQFGYWSEPRETDWGIMRYVVDRVICLQYGLLLECNLVDSSIQTIPPRSVMASVSISMSIRLTQWQLLLVPWHLP